MKRLYNPYFEELEKKRAEFNFRSLCNIKIDGKFIIKDNKKLLNLSSNDYLGISTMPEIRKDFLKNYDKELNVPSARLLCANTESYYNLEKLLADKFNKEACLLFNSGYHANVGIYSSLCSVGDVIFCDKLNHASIIDGIRLSGAKLIPFRHGDYNDLELKLKKYRKNFKKAIIATEALFSMDGDFCDLDALIELKNKFEALLIVDEAHSFGVYGGGAGYCCSVGKLKDVDLIMATFGKAVGSYGAFCVGERVLIDYLTNFARSFIFSTVFPQISADFAHYVLKNHIFSNNKLQEKLLNLANLAHNSAKKEDINILGSSYILPFVFGESKKAVLASKKLMEMGYFSLAIRYPTVAKGAARLRVSLNSAISEKEVLDLISQIKKLYMAL